MKYILITGVLGFIGSNLLERLLKDENNIIIGIDNLSSGSLKDFMINDRFIFIKDDVINEIKINEKIDEIYHLACPASPSYYQLNHINTLKTNFLGTLNVLELAKKNNCKILLTSTSEVYGDPNISPQNEEYLGNVNSFGIRSCYDEGKRVAESLMYAYNKHHNIDIKIVRIFNTYGTYMDKNDGRVISNFINQAIRNEDITIYGDGSYTRSFQYIDDLINGLLLLMESDYKKPINIGNPEEYTILYLAELIIKLTNSKSKIIYLPSVEDDPKKRKPNIDKAIEILHWKPTINLLDGLEKTIQYYNKIL